MVGYSAIKGHSELVIFWVPSQIPDDIDKMLEIKGNGGTMQLHLSKTKTNSSDTKSKRDSNY